jgi:diguanylate cyclase (GGDEF)-like protein
MANTTRFLDKLVNLTAIHDLEMMEYSLLKTLEEFINPLELLILKFDRNGQPCYRLHLRKEKYEIIWEDISIPEEILAGIDIVSRTKQAFSQSLGSTSVQTIWHILHLKAQEVFLVTTTNSKLDDLDMHMVNGLLGIYRNFYAVLSDSHLDQLTGLSNRKTFDDTINKIQMLRPLATDPVPIDRRDEPKQVDSIFWLGMSDLDSFKRVNDTWGHLYGDEVLLLTSQLMQGHFRENDYLFRFGGEEFVIIVCAPTEERALLAFERFRLAIEAYEFPQVGQVTISIGVTKLDKTIFTATLLDHADKALYFAKQNGRNQIRTYENLIESGDIVEPEIIPGEIKLF